MMVEQEGPALPNIQFLFGILLVSTIIIYFMHGKGIEQACHWFLMIWILSYNAVVFLATTFAYVEHHTSLGGTSGEMQPLLYTNCGPCCGMTNVQQFFCIESVLHEKLLQQKRLVCKESSCIN